MPHRLTRRIKAEGYVNNLELQKVSDGVIITVFVKPNSKRFQLKIEGNELIVLCRESPVRGRVNKELIKELSRIFKRRADIVAGFTSKQKKVLIPNISADQVNAILSTYVSQ
jgi:uncharacterized protein (TIGR00251 family)